MGNTDYDFLSELNLDSRSLETLITSLIVTLGECHLGFVIQSKNYVASRSSPPPIVYIPRVISKSNFLRVQEPRISKGAYCFRTPSTITFSVCCDFTSMYITFRHLILKGRIVEKL